MTELHPREIEQEAEFQVRLFGRLKVTRALDGSEVTPGGRRRALEILAWFVLNPGVVQSADQFIDLLWPEADPDKAMSNFHVSIHALRRMLEPDLRQGQESTFIRRHANKVYSFVPAGRWWSDVDDLELLYQRGHDADLAGESSRARFYYRRVSGYAAQNELLPELAGDWLVAHRQKYATMCTHSLGRLLALDQAAGDREELLETAYSMLRLNRYHEPALRVAVQSCLEKQNHTRAARLAAGFCTGLEKELGLKAPADLLGLLQPRSPHLDRSPAPGRRLLQQA